jgi:D-aminopeptidase
MRANLHAFALLCACPMKRLDALCHSLFPANAPGVAIGVLAGNTVRYAMGFGLANLESKIPFTPKTQFRACSICKQFVCLLVRQLEREGKIDLDSHLSRYVPSLTAFPATLRVRHLCQNRSGLQDYWATAMLSGTTAESRFTLDDGGTLIRTLTEPMFAPGTQYRYSNGNWRILEWIIEAVTKRTLPDLLAERVFTRLGMRDSGWGSDTGAALAGNPRGYRHLAANGIQWEEEITRACWSGDAALTTTLDDHLRWEAAMPAPATIALPCADTLGDAMPHSNGEPGYYAFGINAWQQGGGSERGGRWMHWHSGALRGWRMVQMRFPRERTAIVVMMNRTENPLPYALKIAECIGVKTTWDVVAGQPAPPAHDLNGTYFSTALGLLAEIRGEEDMLTLDLGSESVPLHWTGKHTLANASGFYRLERLGSHLDIRARQFGWREPFLRLPFRDDRTQLAGKQFRCAALRSVIVFSGDGTTLQIHGPGGESDVYPVRALAEGFVAFDCDRALDELPPGRFTIRIGDAQQRIEVGCFLASGFVFEA